MTSYKLHAGTILEVPSTAEIAHEIAMREAIRDRERARTQKWTSQGQGNTVTGAIFIGPFAESGYAWNLKLVSVQLDSADTVQAFIASSAPSTGATPYRLISNFGASATSQVTTWSSSQVYLRSDEGLYLKPAAHNIIAWYVTAEQTMAEMQAKSYD